MSNVDYKKNLNHHQRNRLQTKKLLFSTVLASSIVIGNVPSFTIGNLSINPLQSVSAASLADVQLLTDVEITADLSEAADKYNLALGLTGNGLADAELLTPDRTVIFYAPQLAGKLSVNDPAQVRVEILPITMENLPGLSTTLSDLTRTLNTTVEDLVTGVDTVINENSLTSWIIKVEGLEQLNSAIAALNNLDKSLANLLAYEGDVNVKVNDNGSLVVDFSDDLGNHLETVVQDVVVKLLNDVIEAAKGVHLSILPAFSNDNEVVAVNSLLPEPDTNNLLAPNLLDGIRDNLLNPDFLGGVLDELLDPIIPDGILDELLTTVTRDAQESLIGSITDLLNPVQGLIESLSTGTVSLTNDLVGVQALGKTTVSLNATVAKPAQVENPVIIHAASISPSAIDVELFTNWQDSTEVTFNEDNGTGSDQDNPDDGDTPGSDETPEDIDIDTPDTGDKPDGGDTPDTSTKPDNGDNSKGNETAPNTSNTTNINTNSKPNTNTSTSGQTLPNTSTGMWNYVLAGAVAILTGLAAKVSGRRKFQ